MKLAYLADRDSIIRRGVPIVGGTLGDWSVRRARVAGWGLVVSGHIVISGHVLVSGRFRDGGEAAEGVAALEQVVAKLE